MSPADALVEITQATHGVEVALAYAGPDNLAGEPIYEDARCWVHRDLEPALVRAAALSARAGFRLRILDAYRTPGAHERLCAFVTDPRYIADPRKGSNHSRGTAVDVTLVDADGHDLDMGTAFDAMEEASHHSYPGLSAAARCNRNLLLDIMTNAGFQPLDEEWWHYQLPGARSYPLISSPLPKSVEQS